VTVLGAVYIKELALASETLFTQTVIAERTQYGCTRFCFVPGGSRVPRRYQCHTQPVVNAPSFTSIRYGEPGYAQLSRMCAEEIRTGAEDGAEMGAFQQLQQPQREANLRLALNEYLPLTLEAGIFYVT
jgi:hypothetical protein